MSILKSKPKLLQLMIMVIAGVALLLILLYYSFSSIYPIFSRLSTPEEAYKKIIQIGKPDLIDILELDDIAVAVCRKNNTLTRELLVKDKKGWIPSYKNNIKTIVNQNNDEFVYKILQHKEKIIVLIYDIVFSDCELNVKDSQNNNFIYSKVVVNGIEVNTWVCEMDSIPEEYVLTLNGADVLINF